VHSNSITHFLTHLIFLPATTDIKQKKRSSMLKIRVSVVLIRPWAPLSREFAVAKQQKTAIPSDGGFGRVFMVAGAGFEPA